jgi:hypothetical protein
MAAETVLESIVHNLKPRRHTFSAHNVVQALGIAAKLLPLAVIRQPALAPLQGVIDELLRPASSDPTANDRIIMRIRGLKARMRLATNDIEQRRLKEQVDVLFDLLIDED